MSLPDVVGWVKRRRRGFNVGGWNFQHLRCGIHNQSGQPAIVFHDENAVASAGRDFLLAQALAQIGAGIDRGCGERTAIGISSFQPSCRTGLRAIELPEKAG